LRNGEALVGPKLANLRAQQLGGVPVELVFASDGSTDGTVSRLAQARAGDLQVVELKDHGGKARALNAAVAASRGELLVFTDADALLAPGALAALLAPFARAEVGGVCGQRRIAEGSDALAGAQSDYVSFDSRIKAWESARGRLTSNDGKLYALRRSAFRPVPDGVTDDLWSCLQAIRNGHEFVFAPDAVAEIRLPSRDPAHEVSRRRRIVARSLRGIWIERGLFSPGRYGDYGPALFVNKVLRRCLPLLGGLFALGVALLSIYALRFALLLAPLLGLGALALLSPHLGGGALGRAAGAARYVLLGTYGTWLGVLDFLRGRSVTAWDPRKQDAPTADDPRIAYLVSRFPKVTETFVLHEVVGLLERGLDLHVFPLQRHADGVRHAEVEALLPRVHHEPFHSPALLAANLRACLSPARTAAGFLRGLACAGWSANHLAGLVFFFPRLLWIAERLRALRITHLHAHFANHPTLAAAVLQRLTFIPYSFIAHGSDLHVRQSGLAAKLRHAHFALTISDYNRRFAEHAVGPGLARRFEILRCGVDTERFHPVPRRAHAGTIRILCVAALRRVKGHRALIEAARLLAERGVRFELELIGDGPERRDLEQRVEAAGLTRSITFHGSRPSDFVRAALDRADIAVLASILDRDGRREGIPVSLMEAMASGLPVVASRISGIPELVEDDRGGLLVEPGDAAALAAALERLCKDPERRARLGSAGRARVLAEYNLELNLQLLHSRFATLRPASALPAQSTG
jgi:colanic acid/amylovoran biosynthesis glycosyltransferase